MKRALHTAWITRLRRRLATWLMPEIDTAHGKRHLEKLARESGASWSVAKRIASNYFASLHELE